MDELDEKTLKELIDQGRIDDPKLCVMDNGMNLSLDVSIKNAGRGTLHTKRGGVRIMSPQAALRFAGRVLGADEIKVILKNERK